MTRNYEVTTIAEINGWVIQKVIYKKVSELTWKPVGAKKAVYDVNDGIDGDTIESFRTLREAKEFCKKYRNNW